MITMSNFGQNGRLGNQLFQLASLVGLADKHKQVLKLPDWEYEYVFLNYSNYVKPLQTKINKFDIEETKPGYTLELDTKKRVTNIKGYLQSYKYFENIDVKDLFQFSFSFIDHVRLRYDIQNVFLKPIIAIHIRRGDYIDNPNYYQLPIRYYIQALLNIVDWQEHNIIIFSDDIEYCKVHFQCLSNVYFAEGTPIEDLCLMTQCDKYIISNSSFSYWGAILSKNPNKQVFRPSYHFKGELEKQFKLKDYYPADWIEYNHVGDKISLEDVAFTIPVKYDHKDRKQNLNLSIEMLLRNFDTNIFIGEQGGEHFKYTEDYTYYSTFENMNEFHRTKMLNELAKKTKCKIIVNWDCDVFIPPLQLYLAVEKVRNGADMVYPYDGRFRRMPRVYYHELKKYADIGVVGNNKFDNDPVVSLGGAVIFKKETFLKEGGENEKFISFGAEDTERFVRFKTLGYKVKRITGSLYHLNHHIGIDSSTKNPYFLLNRAEFNKIYNMDKEDLEKYIKKEFTWKI